MANDPPMTKARPEIRRLRRHARPPAPSATPQAAKVGFPFVIGGSLVGHSSLSAAFLALLLFLAGCGGNTVRVQGRLVKDGQPFAANLSGDQPDTLAIDFLGEDGGRKTIYSASVNPDGSFSVDGDRKA